jgi:hypothetical protein
MNISSAATSKPSVSRRAFIRALGFVGTGIVLTHWLVRRALAAAGDWYRRALLQRDFNGPAVTVYKMVPLSGVRYSKADLAHMEHKIFPSIEAARRCRTHQAFFYGLKAVQLPRSATNGLAKQPLFLTRKAFEPRGRIDRRHWTRLGVSVDNIVSLVRNG